MIRFKDSLLTNKADVKLAVIFLVLASVLLALALTVMDSLLLAQAAVTAMLASVIYLLLRWARRRRQASDMEEEEQKASLLPVYVNQLLDIAFWGLLAASLLMLRQGVYARPLVFLIMVSVMAAILAVQIFDGRNTGYCIFKVMVIGVLLRASAYYQFPGVAGYDTVAEITYPGTLLAEGHTGSFMGGYQYYPVAHYFTSATSLLAGMGISDSFFILSVSEVLSLIFIFLIGRHFFNTRTGLLAMLLIAVFNWHIIWGFYIKAMTYGIALLPMILFLILTSIRRGRLIFMILTLLAMSLLIMTHTFVTAALVVILAVGWSVFSILRLISSKDEVKPTVTLNIVLLLVCATLAYWMYVSGFTVYIASTIEYALSLDPQELAAVAFPRGVAEEVWIKLPTFIFILFAILGCLAVFNIRELSQRVFSRLWLALLCGAMVIINFLIFYIPQLGPLVRERWFVFVGLIVAMPAAWGIMHIAGRKSWQALASVFLLVLCLSGIMTTSYVSNVQSVIPWGFESYYASTASELAAADTVSRTFVSADDDIYADHYYSQVFRWHTELLYEQVVDFSYIYSRELDEYQGVLVLRSNLIEIVSSKKEIIMDEERYRSLLNETQSSLIYDNGLVKALQRY